MRIKTLHNLITYFEEKQSWYMEIYDNIKHYRIFFSVSH